MHLLLKVFFIIFFLATSFRVDAQIKPKDNYYFWNYKTKPLYFGMTAGINSTSYFIRKSSAFSSSQTINYIESPNQPGLNANFIANLKIGEYFDFRFNPGFAYSEKQIEFTGPNDYSNLEKLESFYIELPIHLRFKSDPYRDKRLFVIGGLKYSYNVSNNSRAREDLLPQLLNIAPHDFQVEVGFGIQMFYPYFIFSPEIKFSHGIGNIHIYNGGKEESRIIDRILSRALTISFHIEG